MSRRQLPIPGFEFGANQMFRLPPITTTFLQSQALEYDYSNFSTDELVLNLQSSLIMESLQISLHWPRLFPEPAMVRIHLDLVRSIRQSLYEYYSYFIYEECTLARTKKGPGLNGFHRNLPKNSPTHMLDRSWSCSLTPVSGIESAPVLQNAAWVLLSRHGVLTH